MHIEPWATVNQFLSVTSYACDSTLGEQPHSAEGINTRCGDRHCILSYYSYCCYGYTKRRPLQPSTTTSFSTSICGIHQLIPGWRVDNIRGDRMLRPCGREHRGRWGQVPVNKTGDKVRWEVGEERLVVVLDGALCAQRGRRARSEEQQ